MDCTAEKPIGLNVITTIQLLCRDLGVPRVERREIVSRTCHEGIPFVTKILPQLSKHVLTCIEKGHWVPLHDAGIYGFKLRKSNLGSIPQIGFAFITRFFDPDCPGDEKALALYKLRQFCEYLYKLALPPSDEQLALSTKEFIGLNAEVARFSAHPGWVRRVRKVIAKLFPEPFKHGLEWFFPKDACINPHMGVGRCGSPGTSRNLAGDESLPLAERKLLSLGTYPRDLEAFSGFFRLRRQLSVKQRIAIVDSNLSNDPMLRVSRVEPGTKAGHYRVSKLTFVNKDSRGPRKITVEPYETIEFQMAFHHMFRNYLQQKSNGQIQFTVQDKFKALARQASQTGSLATLDLKDASDRVSCTFIDNLLDCTAIIKHIRLFRSDSVEVAGVGVVKLGSLAGMGSGYTFPVMALTIYASILAEVGLEYKNQVYVYGDDVIVPTHLADSAKNALAKSGLKVNESKSFVHGPFRESCGGDYLLGYDVVPIRLKLANCKLIGAKGIVSPDRLRYPRTTLNFLILLERHCRELQGFPLLREYYYSIIEDAWTTRLPTIAVDSPVCGRAFGKPTLAPSYTMVPGSVSQEITHPVAFLGAMQKDMGSKVCPDVPLAVERDALPDLTSTDHRYRFKAVWREVELHERFPEPQIDASAPASRWITKREIVECHPRRWGALYQRR